jgi:hypothetical protein
VFGHYPIQNAKGPQAIFELSLNHGSAMSLTSTTHSCDCKVFRWIRL